jgi:hypothetical protein
MVFLHKKLGFFDGKYFGYANVFFLKKAVYDGFNDKKKTVFSQQLTKKKNKKNKITIHLLRFSPLPLPLPLPVPLPLPLPSISRFPSRKFSTKLRPIAEKTPKKALGSAVFRRFWREKSEFWREKSEFSAIERERVRRFGSESMALADFIHFYM